MDESRHPRRRQRLADLDERLREHHLPPLSVGVRVLLFVVGWTLLLIGIAGLALPGIQGVLTIAIGAAVLSLVSESVYRWLRRVLGRWPALMERVDGFRARLHGRLSRDPGGRSRGADGDDASRSDGAPDGG